MGAWQSIHGVGSDRYFLFGLGFVSATQHTGDEKKIKKVVNVFKKRFSKSFQIYHALHISQPSSQQAGMSFLYWRGAKRSAIYFQTPSCTYPFFRDCLDIVCFLYGLCCQSASCKHAENDLRDELSARKILEFVLKHFFRFLAAVVSTPQKIGKHAKFYGQKICQFQKQKSIPREKYSETR